jgi:hypothetical protein
MGDKPPFLGTRLDDKVAPIPAVRRATIEPPESTQSGSST